MTPGASSFSAEKLAAVPASGLWSGRELLVFWVDREVSDLGSEYLREEDGGGTPQGLWVSKMKIYWGNPARAQGKLRFYQLSRPHQDDLDHCCVRFVPFFFFQALLILLRFRR